MRLRLLLIVVMPLACFCQNSIGLPDVVNYHKKTYNAGLQNWDIRQDKNGIIYIANNEGLLSYDGKYWKLYPLPNKTIVRSVEIGSDNRIYVGGQDEFGYFAPARNGNLGYHSLVGLIPEKDRSFADVWDIASYRNDIFFRTSARVFRVANETVSVFHAPQEWTFLAVCNGHLFAHDNRNGLLQFQNDLWSPWPDAQQQLVNTEVTGILPLQNDSMVITTLKNGVFISSRGGITRIVSPAISFYEQQRIYSATSILPGWIALATSNGGVGILNTKGELIQRFAKTEGLQNNNILSIYLDQQQNLWLGLDNGIDCIAFNSAVKHIIPDNQDGSGYAAIIHNNNFYAGTSGGLFSVPLQASSDLSFSRGVFTAVANTTGQVWSLASINSKLLLGHHEGAFLVENNGAKPVIPKLGFWKFVPMSDVLPAALIVAGDYRGLSLFRDVPGGFSPEGRVPVFSETSRFVELDKAGNIWVSHPYHGVYRVSPKAGGNYTWKLYTSENGLPSTLNNHVYKLKNELVVATEKGVYTYNSSKDIFEVSPRYKEILGDQSLRYLKEDTEGNTWFIHDKTLGVADMSGPKPVIIYLPELSNKLLSGFEFIYPINKNNIIVGGERGFFHINYEKYKKTVPSLSAKISMVRIVAKKDSLLFGGYFSNVNDKQVQDRSQEPRIAHKWKTIHFEFASPLFGQPTNLEYSYRLTGFDENWSEWSSKTEKEYTNLPARSYRFEVRVRNNLGSESEPVAYVFRVLPPWHQTAVAYAVYFLLCCVGIYYLYKWQRKKFIRQQEQHEKEQQRMQYLHQLELDKAENELVALRNEKLQAEIDFKNSELANSAMHLVHKGELLSRFKTELTSAMKKMEQDKGVNELKKMLKVLSEDDKMDKDWEHFAQHFDKVHTDFITSLKEKYPALTNNELKLCAYLRMNLSTKEIAQLMNISVRGVEISRYRLRKKLNLATETSLFDFLIELKS